MKKTSKNYWGFDVRDMDKTVRPQDDFYHYANGGWLKKNKIPSTEGRWGSFTMLRVETEHQLKAIVEELFTKKNLKKGTPEQMVRDLYDSGMNLTIREKLGTTPLNSFFEAINSIQTLDDLQKVIAQFHYVGPSVPWTVGIDQDSKDSSKYALHIVQSGLGLPDKEYYLKDSPEVIRVREAYKKHLSVIFGLLGYTKEQAAARTQTVMQVETRLAKISMDKEDTRDAEKTYYKKSLAELARLTPNIKWNQYWKEAHIPRMSYVIVAQPRFIQGVSKLLKEIPLEDWKVYLEWHVTDDAAPFLTRAFTKANFAFYGTALAGIKKMKPDWRRALGVANGVLGEALGQLYVKRHFTPHAKRKMDELVSDLFAAYEKRISALSWMTPATKRKAVQKLRMITRKIGYPKKWKSYKGLEIKPDTYFENILRSAEFEHRRQMKKLKGPIDRDEWHMSPQTVNAYCNFNLNEIVFPAAILQPPFFSLDADDAVNYGAIGYTIGHEMTHAFDDQGAKFDGRGNMKTWWTTKDKKQFEKKGKILVKQYNEYEVSGGVSVNGQLTLGENIADLGGVYIAYDAYQERLKKTGRKNIHGLTPEQRFFFGMAQQERELIRPELEKMFALNDPHSPGIFRVNGPFSNFPPFYEAFGVKSGDKLYRKKEDRAEIW